MTAHHAPLIEQFLPSFIAAASLGSVLDLACGNGRNGLFLLSNQIPVTFADINPNALRHIDAQLGPHHGNTAQLWQTDFEQSCSEPLQGKRFGGVMVFRYLHRPLMAHIKAAMIPGGIVAYETFTIDQVNLGRPKNPDFLLRHGELLETFSDWQVCHSFEGITEHAGTKQAVAQLVAIKPS